MSDKKKLSSDALDLLSQVFSATSASDLENAKQVVEGSGFDEEVTAPVLELLDAKIKEFEAADDELTSILDRQDVKSTIQSKVDEAAQPLKDDIKKLEGERDTANNDLKSAAVDAILAHTIVLRKDPIDFENVESSASAYRKELSSKSYEDLKESLSGLSSEVTKTFSGSPSERLGDEASRENGAQDPSKASNDKDRDKEKKTILTLSDFIEAVAGGATVTAE